MEFNVLDRLLLLNILPKEGDFTTLKIIRELREGLSFAEEEHAALNFENEEGGNVKWNSAADVPKEVVIGEKAETIIKDILKGLSEEKKLKEAYFDLFVKFVGE